MSGIKILTTIISIIFAPLTPKPLHAQEIAPVSIPIPIVIMPFTDGTPHLRNWVPPRRRYYESDPDLSNIGSGIAEMLSSQLSASGVFRILDRGALDAVIREQNLNGNDSLMPNAKIPGARFVVTGTITECWTSNNDIGGVGGKLMRFGMLGYNRRKTKMKMHARIIDSYSGAVVASIEADGESTKGSSVTVAGLGRGGFGAGHAGGQAGGEALAQAAARSAQELAEKIIAKQGNLLTI